MLSTARWRRLGQRGDTIVEVMVVLAVLGLALGIAYRTANVSARSNQRAQDNSQAVAILKGQVELLRAHSNDPAIYVSAPFCMTTANTINTDLTTCKVGIYKYSIQYSNADSNNPDLFTLKIVWDDVDGGTDNDSSTLVYREHQEP